MAAPISNADSLCCSIDKIFNWNTVKVVAALAVTVFLIYAVITAAKILVIGIVLCIAGKYIYDRVQEQSKSMPMPGTELRVAVPVQKNYNVAVADCDPNESFVQS